MIVMSGLTLTIAEWGPPLIRAAFMTLAVAVFGFCLGAVFGGFGAWAKTSQRRTAVIAADLYTTLLRGIPDLLVVYLFYFGGSMTLTAIARLFGAEGFWGMPAFIIGGLALGIVAGAYQTEVFRGAYNAVPQGQREAGRTLGLSRWLSFRLVLLPQILRLALPGLANVWQMVLKDSALISVTGLVEIIRESQLGAGSTRQPFLFYLVAALLYLVITSLSAAIVRHAERRFRWEDRRA